MEQINTTDVEQTAIGRLFRACGANGDGTPLTPEFMNGLMMEVINTILKSCQTPLPFDKDNPASYDQLWLAITQFGGSCGVNRWATGTTDKLVSGTDCQFYFANPNGDPPNNNPVGGDGSHWFGPFCSVGEAMNAFMGYVLENCCDGTVEPPPDDCCAEIATAYAALGTGTPTTTDNTTISMR